MTQRILASLLAILFIVGCQPAPEERFARAENYFAEADYRAVVIELKNALQERPDYPQARLLLAEASYLLADFQTAQSEFERTLSLGLNTPDVWMGLGKSLLAQGDAAGALERVVPNLSAETATPEQLVLLGDTYLALGNRDEAAQHYVLALNIESSTPGALIGQAVIAGQTGEAVLAEELLANAIELNPDSDLVWRAKGNYLRATRQHAAAADAFDRSIALETGATPMSERLMARVNRVSALIDGRELDEAQEKFKQLQAGFPNHPVVRFLNGRLAYTSGDYKLAEIELRAYLADIPNDLRGYALLGAVNFSQNHLRQAEFYLAQAVRNSVGDSDTARLLAETRLRLNRPAEALSALGQNGADGATDPTLLSMYGRAQLGLGNTAEALAYFEQGLAAGSQSPAVNLSLAAGLYAAGENERAIQVLENIPDHVDAKYRRETLLIAAHIKEGNSAAALRVGGDVLEANPNDAVAHALVGVLQQSLGDLSAARVAFERALVLDASNQASSYALSRLEILEGNYTAAEKLLTNLLDVDPGYVQGLITLAGVYMQDGRVEQIEPRIQAAIDANPELLAPRLLQIRVALLQVKPDEALRAVSAAKLEFPDEPRILHAEGMAQVQAGQPEAALISLRNAANGDRSDPTFQFDLAALSFRSDDIDTAADAIGRYRELRPESFRGLALQVAIHARQGNHDAARATVNDYAAKYPDEKNVLILRGDIEMGAGNAENAVTQYELAAQTVWNRDVAIRLARSYQSIQPEKAGAPLERWLDENPDDAEVRRLYGQYLEQQGDRSAAMAEYERLVAANQADPIALNNLAWQYAMDGRDGAASLAEKAHELAPDNGSITDTYGWILYLNGDIEAALPLLTEASNQSPDNPEVQYHLAAVHAKVGNNDAANDILTDLLKSNQSFPAREAAEELAKSL